MFCNLARVVSFFFATTAILVSPAASAFGLKTHVWIAQRLIDEVQTSCRVKVEGVDVPIKSEVCESIRSHPSEFLSGVLGPDAYPDLITGQVTTHPGIEGDWQTNDWLIHLYARAAPGPELAFAAGYLVHAASDTFAHSYVNAYAGDIFSLTDERRVELRHFLLEKYIDARLPGFSFNSASIAPPSDWLRDKLIHDPNASRLSKGSGVALHITSMFDIHRNVSNLADDLDRIEKEAAELIIEVPVQIAEASQRLASGEVALDTASVTLHLEEKNIEVQSALLEAENKVLQEAIRLLQENIDEINFLGQQARLAREAAEAARQTGKDSVDEAERLNGRLLNLERQIQGIPQLITREVCRDEVVGNVCSVFCSFCGEVCKDTVNSVCRVVQEGNTVWVNLNNEILNLRSSIANLQASIAKAGIDVTTQIAVEQAKLQEKASKELLTAGLQIAKDAAQAKYDVQKGLYDAQAEVTRQAREEVDRIKEEIAKLRQRLIDLDGVRDALVDLLARSDILSGLAKNWRSGMRTAGREFINASSTVATGLIDGKGQVVSTYLQWWKCYGNSYAGIPPQIGESVCGFENLLAKLDEEVNKIVERTLPPPFNQVYSDFIKIKGRVKNEINNAVSDGVLHFAKLVAPDESSRQFIDVLARPENASQDAMNDAFATAADSDKPLLVFGRISDLVDADLALESGKLNPDRFFALRNAVTLSKLALMDVSGLRKLAWVIGADESRIQLGQSEGRGSVLFDMLRSIDGNHQWQPYGLPYASVHSAARPDDPMKRRYGYGPGQERPGLQLFVNEELRRTMFLRIFYGPLNPGLQPLLGNYPFPECAHHPFAVAFSPDGAGATNDPTCTRPGTIPISGPTTWEWLRRLLNIFRLNPAN